jgi:hypothetical protein
MMNPESNNGQQPKPIMTLDATSKYIVLVFMPDGKNIAVVPNNVPDDFEVIGMLMGGLSGVLGTVREKVRKNPPVIISLPPGSRLPKVPSL